MIMENFFWVVSLIICFLLSFKLINLEAAPQDALITQIPGFNGTLPSKHYGGYVTFDEKNLFYYFIVSERNPSEDPVVLWLNGGPGCSSFDGFVYEHGPFNYEKGQSEESLPILHLNPYSWSKVSNIIYLDSPCGVGLSYSNKTSNYKTDDWHTAADTHTFLLKWFELYPEFAKNPFYISGESYAGIYVPTLATEVVKGIKIGVEPIINFKGYLVGNGVTDTNFDGTLISLLPFAHGMGLVSDDIYQGVQAACYGNQTNQQNCYKSVDKVYEAISGLNIYDILEPCYHDPNAYEDPKGNKTSLWPVSFQQLGQTEKPLKVRKRMFGRAWPLRGQLPPGTLWPELAGHGSVMCFDDEVATAWLNDESVRKAIHAEPKSVAGEWELCSSRITYSSFSSGSMLPYHRNLTTQGYRALIYSGDHDMCVPFTGTQAWTRSLEYKIIDEWRSWKSNNEVAGYLQGYDYNFTFLTIKGAGHTVPEYKPRESLDFYSRWLDEKPI
ncbi:serine carboxypeptidase-like 20 [Jatropha curcas]|uniref:serine carboxypeptidase-like 20 n=1 Tax=Jatropha curcas TaxID=180498 RepID=UPI0005FC14A4|nr:serine carboxypeptidase-like 20 [Jatropha curcas]